MSAQNIDILHRIFLKVLVLRSLHCRESIKETYCSICHVIALLLCSGGIIEYTFHDCEVIWFILIKKSVCKRREMQGRTRLYNAVDVNNQLTKCLTILLVGVYSLRGITITCTFVNSFLTLTLLLDWQTWVIVCRTWKPLVKITYFNLKALRQKAYY